MKREPDAFGRYVYNKFATYGLREVMDNMVGFLLCYKLSSLY